MPKANLYGPAMEPDPNISPEPKWPSAAASVFVWASERLAPPGQAPSDRELRAIERELATARAELASLHELLEEIPEIFERKFEQRLQPLLAENHGLRHQVMQLQSRDNPFREAVLLPPTDQGQRHGQGQGQRPRFGQVIRHAFGLRDAA